MINQKGYRLGNLINDIQTLYVLYNFISTVLNRSGKNKFDYALDYVYMYVFIRFELRTLFEFSEFV